MSINGYRYTYDKTGLVYEGRYCHGVPTGEHNWYSGPFGRKKLIGKIRFMPICDDCRKKREGVLQEKLKRIGENRGVTFRLQIHT